MKKARLVLILLTFVMLLSACESQDMQDRRTVNSQQEVFRDLYPIRIYPYSIPMYIYRQIYDMITLDVTRTYTVVTGVNGDTFFECPSIGFPIPTDVQLTNPMQASGIEQAEPNGLFTSDGTDATWVVCVMPDGKATVQYFELKANAFPYPVHYDAALGRYVQTNPENVVETTIDISDFRSPDEIENEVFGNNE